MIRISRPPTPPESLHGKLAATALAAVRDLARSRKPASKEFSPVWGERDVRDALHAMQHGKCAYCEDTRYVTRESDIEHFRPKAEVTGAPDHKGYWWLAYDWNNLFFSCRICNAEYKKNHFPVAEDSPRASNEGDDLARERAYLLDPCNDQPERFLGYRIDLDDPSAVAITALPGAEWDRQRAEKTIKVLGLDRAELRRERGLLLRTLEQIRDGMGRALLENNQWGVARMAGIIREETAPDLPFAGWRRDFFRQARLGQYIDQRPVVAPAAPVPAPGGP